MIRVSSNGRYFVTDEGEPFFWLGDTQWQLFRDFSPADATAVLEHRRLQGFTVAQIMITGVGDGARPNLAGQTPWLGNDPATPNEAYFRNVDDVIEAARQLGMILVPGVFHQVQRDVITCENARSYAGWLARRYRDVPNMVWAMYPEAKMEFLPVLRELAAGLREGDDGAHMITVHPDPSPTSSSFIHQEDWLDFNSNQPCVTYEMIYEMVSADYACTPPKPVVMAEGGYEGVEFGKTQTALEIRKQAYWSYLPGGHHTYGHNDSWTSPASWRSWIDSPGARSLSVCKRVLTGLPEWWNLVPDQSVFASGEGQGLTLNVAARSASRDWTLAYLSGRTTVCVRTDGATEAFWIDPTTGEQNRIEGLPGANPREFSTPQGWDDALLLLRK